MMKKVFKAVFVIIGTLIGAGFASGQEIYLFFYQYGMNGVLGIIISSLLIGIVIYKVLHICEDRKITNYRSFLKVFIKNEKQLEVFNTIINIFILITFYIMIAGFGAYFEQQFEVHGIVGSIILALICYIVFLKDVSGLIKVSQYIVPLLVGSLFIIGLFVVDFKNILEMYHYVPKNASWKWILDSVLYGSYNTILLIPVLITLRNLVSKKKERRKVSLWVIALVILLSLVIFLILTKIDVDIKNLEMPAVYVVSKISPVFRDIYGFIILSSILTTSISLGTSLLENIVKDKKKYKQYAIFICVSAILVSNIGFSNLVNLLYPIFGYIGLIQIIKICTEKSKQVNRK